MRALSVVAAMTGIASADEPPPVAPSPAAPAELAVVAVARSPVRPEFPLFSTSQLELELELTTQALWLRRAAGDDLTEFQLDRGEAGVRVGVTPDLAAEMRVEAVRSAVGGGTLGVDGDSTVLRVKRALVTGRLAFGGSDATQLRVDGALGFVPDPWIESLERDYTAKPLSRTGSERLLGWPTSDLSVLGRASLGPVRLSVTFGNGEGVRFPERNAGKTTTAVLEGVPLNTHDVQLRVAAVVRDGSLGPALVRDRRAGGGAAVTSTWVRGGGEVVRAYGIGDDGAATGWLISGWADGRVVEHIHVAARGATLGFDSGGRRSTFGGAVAVEPWHGSVHTNGRGNVRIWLAIDRTTSSGTAMPLAGADPGDATSVLLIASTIAPFVVP